MRWLDQVSLAVGAQIRTYRAIAGLTQSEVARMLGTHREIVARDESGLHAVELWRLGEYAIALGCPLTALLWPVDRLQERLPARAA